MSYLDASRIAFWVIIFAMLTAATIYTVVSERRDARLEAMAEAHRRRRRIQRFNNLNR